MDEDDKQEEFIRLKYEVGRLASDYHSEKRNKERIMERMLMIEKAQHRIEERLDSDRWSFQKIMQLISNLVAAGAVLVMALK